MLKIGIFGLGHLGKIHLKCIQESDKFQLVGFYDTDSIKAASLAKKFNIKYFKTPESLLQEIDVADIVAPTFAHFELANLAIKHKTHFFVEKPICNNVEEAKELCNLIEMHNLYAQVGHVERFNPALLALEGMKINPMFIEAHRLAIYNSRGTDVSVVHDLMIHDLDVILSIIPHKVINISASGVAIISKTEDIANVRLEFENGAVVNLTASRISMKNMRKLRVFQDDAYLSLDFLEKKTEIVKIHETPPNEEGNYMTLETQNGSKFIELLIPESKTNNAIKMELESFADSILNQCKVKVALKDGYKALDLAQKIIEKIDQHKARILKFKQ